MLGGAGSPGGDELLTVTVIRDEQGYGMKVSGDNPVYVQSVKEHGAAWRAGLRAGDRIIRVDGVPVHQHTHQQVVLMIRANPSTILTVHQNSQNRHKTPITSPLPVNPEKQRQVEYTKVNTFRMMLDNEQKYITDLRNELTKVPDVRKQAQLDSAEKRCLKLQREIDSIVAAQPDATHSPATPKLARNKSAAVKPTGSPPPNQSTGFLSGLPRSLSNLTGQSIRNLRQRQKTQENQPPLQRQSSDEGGRKRHNNTVPMVPTTCLDNVTPPPLPPRTIRNPLSPNINPLAKPKPGSSISPSHKYYPRYGKDKPASPMHQSMPGPQYSREDRMNQFRRSSHSLDGELEGPQPNSIAMQMSYPLVNAPPPPVQMDNRGGVPVMHLRSQSSPEHLDHGVSRTFSPDDKCLWGAPPAPPGTPPPPYAHNTQPCADPQRAIISMEEDDSPASDTSTYSGLFSNLRSVRDSKARTAVLLNWLLGERRCASANLLLLITDGYRSAVGVSNATLRRWAYEIHSTFLIPNAVLQLNGVDENMANEIEHVLCNEHDKDELLRNVFRKPRQKAKEELTQQLTEFQVKRQVGLGALYAPEDAVIEKCDVDKAQELVVVERLMSARITAACAAPPAPPAPSAHQALLAALLTAALVLHCRPATVTAAAGGSKACFLQRDKLYKQRLKQLTKQSPQPWVVRGHHLRLQALTAAAHCHACSHVVWGLAPQAAVCADCNLRVHRTCARSIEEPCCLDTEHHNNRISRFMERIHNNQPSQDSSEKKSRKAGVNAHFLNMERSFRKMEDEPPTETTNNNDKESDESLYESADNHSDAISASDDNGPRLKTPTMSKESLKLVVTDEEGDVKLKKGHRKTISLTNPLEMIRNLDPGYLDKKNNMRKSRESLWSEEEVETRKNVKKEKANRKSLSDETKRKSQKTASTMSLNLFRWKKPHAKTVEAVEEVVDGIKRISNEEMLSYTKFFIEAEQRHSALWQTVRQPVDTDTEDDIPTPKPHESRRRLSRQASRSKSKVRGKSQSVRVNTLRKSHSGTLKKAKAKKKGVKTPLAARSRQASMVESTPVVKKKKNFDTSKQTAWLFSSGKGEARREGSSEEPNAPDAEVETADTKEQPDKENTKRPTPSVSRGVNRAESCRERDAPRRGKHRNASDPNRLTAHNHHDLEPGAATAPSGSSSSSSLSSRSNESNTVPAEQQASQSDLSEEDEPLAPQWKDSLPPQVLDTLLLSAKLRKRQEVIHELIVSEGSHVRWLKVLGGVFLKPLESQPALLPPEELKALFPNLPNVKERHSKLYADLRSVKSETKDHIIQIRPVVDAILNTLGDAGYSACLSRFCRNQRMALNALGERRRKHKELAQFLSSREQLPLCGRLQLRDLLPCVWQRLTKYQLLLENILATVEDNDSETEEDIAQLKLALTTAKEVLHSVDTAIRTAENQHRLRTIQSKLEVRAAGPEWHELRSLDLNTKTLLKEGDLMLRCDQKKCSVLALMLEDVLVLLLREGDKFVLKPIAQTNVPGGLLTPMIHWNKVLFRPNAAVRNAFFLVNKKEMQMYELSCSTNAEYATWLKYIEEAPSELQTSHQQQRSTDDSGTNVSRNPSDASTKSSSTAPVEDTEEERQRENSVETQEGAGEETREQDRGEEEGEEERHVARRPTVGRISTHSRAMSPPLQPPPVIAPTLEAPIATVVCTNTERLRRLDGVIAAALRAKSAIVAELVGTTPEALPHLADLALADTLGELDVSNVGTIPRSLGRSVSREEEVEDMHQLLLAAYTQANQLVAAVSGALNISEAAVVAARSGLCDSCRHKPRAPRLTSSPSATAQGGDVSRDLSYDLLPDLDRSDDRPEEPTAFTGTSAASLAARLVPATSGLQASLSRLLATLPTLAASHTNTRRLVCAHQETNDALRARLRHHVPEYETPDELPSRESVDQTIQDQPSNGG